MRPVSIRIAGEISEEERRYEDGGDPQVLDIIEIPIIGPKPVLYQSENYIIDADYYWKKTGKLSWDALKSILDKPVSIWENGDSTRYGKNDRVTFGAASQYKNSLILIEPESLRIEVRIEGAEYGHAKRRLRAKFTYLGMDYSLVVTDPYAESVFLAKADGDYPLKDSYLTISLGEEYDGSCYKLVAAVINKAMLRG